MRKLSNSEKKVLTVLEQDARMPASQIAKKVRLTPEGVIKIIKRLVDAKVIRRFNTKINYSRMGYTLYPVSVKLIRRGSAVVKKLKAVLDSHSSLAWYAFCEGEYDLLLSFQVKDSVGMADMHKCLSEIADFTLEKELAIAMNSFDLSRSFVGKSQAKMFVTTDHSVENIGIGEEDEKLIRILRKNSRQTVMDLAAATGLSSRSIMERIKKMKKNGIITGFKTKINTAVVGYQRCQAYMTFGKCTEQDIKQFTTYCRYTPEVSYLVRQVGKYDVKVALETEDLAVFYEIVDKMREKFPFVKKITTLIAKTTS